MTLPTPQPNARKVEEIQIGGGYDSQPDGGTDIDQEGHIATNGDMTVDGTLTAGTDVIIGDGDGAHDLRLDGGAGHHKNIYFDDDGVVRWRLFMHADESFHLNRYNSSGVFQAATIIADESDTSFQEDVIVHGTLTCNGFLNLGSLVDLEIASGAVTATNTRHVVDVEGGAASTDNLETINGGSDGDLLILRAKHDARTVVLTESGNLSLGASTRSLDSRHDRIVFVYDGELGKWVEVSFTNNN